MTKIGFIGQGWIGKHYADDFENRLYDVVRYALEEPYSKNKDAIKECGIVFVAVPTPTTPEGYSYEPVRDALSIIAPGTTVVIKSTLYPGTTDALQESFPKLFIMHSPEFLREEKAAHDAAHPDRNLIGIPKNTPVFKNRAKTVLKVLPEAPYNQIMNAREAELVKYAGNCFLYTKVVFMNLLYDLVEREGGNWEQFREAFIKDPRIGVSHTTPVHKSGHDTEAIKAKRGAGGHCFIKDFEAFRLLTKSRLADDKKAHELLTAMVAYNNQLLLQSDKDIDLLKGVYGDTIRIE